MLLDAAAFAPTQRLDLYKYKPDFVTLSFYKMFGFPTGLGALIVRNDMTNFMRKRYFGGGTVVYASEESQFCLFHVYIIIIFLIFSLSIFLFLSFLLLIVYSFYSIIPILLLLLLCIG